MHEDDAGLNEQPDAQVAVIITGSICSGMKFYGPFPSIDAAIEHWGKTVGGVVGRTTTITLLEPPQKLK